MKTAARQTFNTKPSNRCRPKRRVAAGRVSVQRAGGSSARQPTPVVAWRFERKFWPREGDACKPVRPDAVAATSEPPGQQETWHVIEDVWLRLQRQCPVKVVKSDDDFEVVFGDFRDAVWERDQLALRYRVMDPDLYRWREDGCQGDFVRVIDYRGSDLVIQMSSMAQIRRGPEGETLAWQVAAFLNRLQALGRRAPVLQSQ